MSSIDMDQYVGSAIRYITDHADEGTAVYFGDVPENFKVPSIYFPASRTVTRRPCARLRAWRTRRPCSPSGSLRRTA